jgi:hypothetical protein
MSRNGLGVYSATVPFGIYPAVAATLIESQEFNTLIADIQDALTASVAKDGQTAMTGNLPMGGNKLTGLGNGADLTDSATLGQVQSGAVQWCGTAGGTANALTLTPSPAITAYAAGMKFRFKSGSSANTAAVTVAISGLSTVPIQHNGVALAAADILPNTWYEIFFSAAGAAQLFASSALPFQSVVSVKDFGATGDGTTDDTTAIQAAVDAVGAAGGGTVFFPAGTYLVSNGNPGAASWDNEVAIWVTDNEVYLRGAGVGATKIKLKDSGNAHVIKFGQRVSATVTVAGGGVSDLEIDGNRTNQATPNDTDDHYQGIDVATGSSRIHLERLYIHDCTYYGIGFQRDTFIDCLVSDVVIENTGADGLDFKNDTSTGKGNHIRNIRVSNFGILSALTNAQAGLDLRSGITLNGAHVSGMTSATDLNGIRLHYDGDGSSLDEPPQPTVAMNCTVIGDGGATEIGIRVISRGSSVVNAKSYGSNIGIQVTRGDCRLVNCNASGNTTGIKITADSTAATEADTVGIYGAVVRNNTGSGIVCESDEVNIVGCDVRSNGTGFEFSAGASAIRVVGGSCSGNTTAISDAASGTIFDQVSGLKTRNVASGNFAIDSTGVKSVTIAHGLGVTPNINDVRLQLKRNTAVTDWAAAAPWTVAADATNITCQVNVTTASGTAAATATMVATIEAKATA